MDLNHIKKMAAQISDSITDCEIGELLFMHHVILETIDMVKELGDDHEATRLCQGIEQSIYNEISRRIAAGNLKLQDPSDFLMHIRDYYSEPGELTGLAEGIKDNILNKKRGRKSPKKNAEFEKRISERGLDFFKKYKDQFGIKESRYPKVPSPDELINGKPPKDIPNN
jgi:hypothetical protein